MRVCVCAHAHARAWQCVRVWLRVVDALRESGLLLTSREEVLCEYTNVVNVLMWEGGRNSGRLVLLSTACPGTVASPASLAYITTL